MQIQTVRDLGATIRAQRRRLGWDQATLAEHAGLSRLWINQVEGYSLLLGPHEVRLAPLYDVASIFAYPRLNPRKAKLAMKVGGRYRLDEIGVVAWREFAKELRVDPDALVERVRAFGAQVPDRLAIECRRLRSSGLDHPVLARIESEVTRRVARSMRGA